MGVGLAPGPRSRLGDRAETCPLKLYHVRPWGACGLRGAFEL